MQGMTSHHPALPSRSEVSLGGLMRVLTFCILTSRTLHQGSSPSSDDLGNSVAVQRRQHSLASNEELGRSAWTPSASLCDLMVPCINVMNAETANMCHIVCNMLI